jgi:hypothetical protein
MPHLRHYWKFVKGTPQLDDEIAILPREPERPWEAHEQASQSSGIPKRPKSILELPDSARVELTVMCELPPKYGRKNKIRVLRYLVDPQFRYLGAQRPMKRGVDFHQVQVLREIFQRMKAAWLDRGIDYGIPIGMQPAGCSAAKSALHDNKTSLFRLLFAFDSIAIRSWQSTGFFLRRI